MTRILCRRLLAACPAEEVIVIESQAAVADTLHRTMRDLRISVTDRCKDVAGTVEAIVLENS